MASLPVALLFGVYLGVLTGIIPALVAWVLGFLFKYLTGVTLPGFGVVVLGVALAGVNGGLLALADPSITQSANAPSVVVALLVIMMMVLYAHSKGDQLGATTPQRLSLRRLGERTLSLDLIDAVGVGDEVRVRVTGEVADIEGYPTLPAALGEEIRASEWTFPADLDLPALERRLAERLGNEYDLGDVSVAIDERGRATVAAAPPFSGLSRRVESGKRAVSVDALVPSGLTRGDVVTVVTSDTQVRGTVLSARSTQAESAHRPDAKTDAVGTDPTPGDPEPRAVSAPTATGGDGQVTVSVGRTDAEALLGSDRATIIVEARGTRREYALISLLRRAGKRFRRVTVRAGSDLAGETLASAAVREEFAVAVLAVRDGSGWQFDPRSSRGLEVGTELYAVGERDGLDAFGEAIA